MSTANLAILKRAMPVVAAITAEQAGVKVHYGQGCSTAATNGRDIYISPLPDDDSSAVVLLRGYIYHEAFHIHESDMSIFSVNKESKALRWHLAMICEDVRIELENRQDNPGGLHAINELCAELVKRGTFSLSPADAHPMNVLSAHVLFTARAHVRGTKALFPIAEEQAKVLEEVMPGITPRLNALIMQIPRCTQSADTFKLADQMIKLVEDYKDEQEDQEPDSNDSNKPNDQSQDQDDSSQGDGSDDGDQAQGGGDSDEQADGDTSNGSQEAGDQGQDDDRGSTSSNGSGDSDSSAKAAAQQIIDDQSDASQCENRDIGDAAQQEIDETSEAMGYEEQSNETGVAEVADGHLLGETINFAQADQMSAGLQTRLRSLVQARHAKRAMPSRYGSQLNYGRLARIAVGDGEVFKIERRSPAVNTAVSILTDRSGSMCGRDIEIAMGASYAMARALESIPHVQREVVAFGGHHHVWPIAKYGEPTSRAKERFTAEVSGSTPMAEGIWHCAHSLAGRRESKKILIVCTDGQPNSSGDTLHAIDVLTRAGVEVIGIGIGTNSVESYFKTSRVIGDVSELAAAMSDILLLRL